MNFESGTIPSISHKPLDNGKLTIGFLITDFEIGPLDGTIYDVLCCQISTALQGALLVAQITRQKFILDTFIETVPDRIYFKDREGYITRANRAHATQMGFRDSKEVIGKMDFDFFQETEARVRFEQEQVIMRTGEPLPAQEEHRTWPDGRTTWSLVTKMPLRDEHGDIIGTFGISRDITDLKRVQHELMQYRDHLEELVDLLQP